MLDMNNKKHRKLVQLYGRAAAKQMLAGAGFAPTLHAAVDASKYTRAQLAREIGCSKNGVDKWLNGTQYPGVHFLLRLAHALYAVYDEKGKVTNQQIVDQHYIAFSKLISLER